MPTPDASEAAFSFGARNCARGAIACHAVGRGPMLSGLFMAQNSHKRELTNDQFEVRGTDAGNTECGGDPWFDKRMVQASAYRGLE